MKTVSVLLRPIENHNVWVNVALSVLKNDYIQGESYITFSHDFRFKIKPLDEEVAQAIEEEGIKGWTGFVMEGAHHGFRKAKCADRGVLLHCLEGCFGVEHGAPGVIYASTLGVMTLLGYDLSEVSTPGWERVQC